MTKDEAIHKALKVLNCLNNDRVYETAWVKGAINACEEALEQPAQEPLTRAQQVIRANNSAQPLTRDWKDTIDECIARDSEFKEALEQPAEPRLVSYALDGSTCTLNIDGEEVYFNREQPAQEPVEVYGILEDGDYISVEATKEGAIKVCEDMNKHDWNCTYKPLYTHPHQWQGLTDDEIDALEHNDFTCWGRDDLIVFGRAIEAKLKEKNYG